MEDESSYRVVGKWTDEEDLNSHLRSEIFSILLGAMNLLKETPEITFYVGSYTASGMERVNIVRGKSEGNNVKLLQELGD
jgi:hypothetical protein